MRLPNEILLGYVGGSRITTGTLEESQRQAYCGIITRQMQCWVEERPCAKGSRWPLEVGKGKEMDSPVALPERNATLVTP